MENGQTLKEFIEDNHPKEYEQSESLDLPTSFIEFLNQIKVLPILSEISHNIPKLDSEHYPEFIDSLVLHLINTKLPNVLANGYVNPSTSAWSTYLVNPSNNFTASFIKNQNCNRVHNIIKRDNFVHLLTNYKGYLPIDSGNYLQIFGPPASFPTSSNPTEIHITNSKLLYRSRTTQGLKRLLYKDSVKELLELNDNPSFKDLLVEWQKNDRSCRYQYIFMNLVQNYKHPDRSILDNSTKAAVVVKYVLTISGKLFPLKTWGSKKNKAIFLSAVACYINSTAHSRHSLNSLLKGLNHQEIGWAYDEDTFLEIINWVFKNIIRRLIQSFWYVTDLTATDLGIYFFPHNVWNKLTKEWFQQYAKRYLQKSEIKSINPGMISQYNYGSVRFIPKLSGFRLILVPAKMPFEMKDEIFTRSYEIEYSNYIRENIDFVRLILTNRCYAKGGVFPLSASVQDVIHNINIFKESMGNTYGNVCCKYHIVKFDMKDCYDRLNQNKLFANIEHLFEDVEDSFTYSIRNFAIAPVDDQLSKRIHLEFQEIHSIENLDQMNFGKKQVVIDRAKTLKFTKRQILEVCKEQIYNTSAILDGSPFLFSRKVGVFQGCPLLSTFCNIAYSNMMNEQFQFLINRETLCLRVADDFLIISTDSNTYEKMWSLINSSKLHKYGAFVNKTKTFLSSIEPNSFFSFLGLRIDAVTLDIYKDVSDNMSLHSYCLGSYKQMFRYLVRTFTSRLENNLINLKFNSFNCVLHNVLANLKAVLKSFLCEYKRIQKNRILEPELLTQFLSEMLMATYTSFTEANGTDHHFSKMKDEILTTIAYMFRNNALLCQIILWIDSQEVRFR